MPKVISAGFLIQSEGKYLLVHATGAKDNKWGIPKGKQEEGESLMDTAIREVFEETGIDLRKEGIQLEDKPFFDYDIGKNKTVYVFKAYDLTGKLHNFDFRCSTNIPNMDIPEISGYRWASAQEALDFATDSQRGLFKKVVKAEEKKK